MLTGIICNDLSCHLFTSYERVLVIQAVCIERALAIINTFSCIDNCYIWYKFVFQTTNSLDMVNIPCFEKKRINQNTVYGQFQHEFIQYWFALIIHPDRRHSVQFACLALN